MDENKYRKFYVEWWNIRKSTIYVLLAIAIFAGLLYGGYWWGSRNNWFLPDDSGNSDQRGRGVPNHA